MQMARGLASENSHTRANGPETPWRQLVSNVVHPGVGASSSNIVCFVNANGTWDGFLELSQMCAHSRNTWEDAGNGSGVG